MHDSPSVDPPLPPSRPADAARRFMSGRWLASLTPEPLPIHGWGRVRAVLGAGIGILFTALISGWAPPAASGTPWLLASIGASAILVFAIPASPLAQPWAVVGGHLVAAGCGLLCGAWIPDPRWAVAGAVAGALATMIPLRCIHPPGGGTAIAAALGQLGPAAGALPLVLADTLLLVFAGMLFQRAAGQHYPQRHAAPDRSGPASRFSDADFDSALARLDHVLDVSRDDLVRLLEHVDEAAFRRRFGNLHCADIMTREPIAITADTPLAQAWQAMRERRVKALPVIDADRRVVGIVTLTDFMRHARLDSPDSLGKRLRALVGGNGASADRPSAAGQIMGRNVQVASERMPLTELAPLLVRDGHHHVPVVDHRDMLVGMLTQSDLIRALYRVLLPED